MDEQNVVECPHEGLRSKPDLIQGGRTTISIKQDKKRPREGEGRSDAIVEYQIQGEKWSWKECTGEDPVENEKE